MTYKNKGSISTTLFIIYVPFIFKMAWLKNLNIRMQSQKKKKNGKPGWNIYSSFITNTTSWLKNSDKFYIIVPSAGTDPNYVTDNRKKHKHSTWINRLQVQTHFSRGASLWCSLKRSILILKQIKYLTLAWYCSRITWPGNSGSGTEANFLIMSSSAWRPAIRSWLLWSVAAMNAMRIRSERWSTKRSSKNKNRRQKGKHFQNYV